MKEGIVGIAGAVFMFVAAGACKKDEPVQPPVRRPEPRVEAPRATLPTTPRETAPTATTTAGPRPAWYPAGFALPAGWRAEGAASVTPHATSGELAWDKPLGDVLANFQKELSAGGWTLKSDEPRGKGGKRMRWEKGGETVQLSIFELDGKAHAIVVPPIRMGAPR